MKWIADETESNPVRSKRLSRQESKAKTRALLISTGRGYFLRRGFAGATAEEISEEAGFTRGALYSHFEDKEGLFLEVVRECHQRRCAMFAKLLRGFTGRVLLEKLRAAFADTLKDPEHRLILEFELESLRNEKLRKYYAAFNQETLTTALNIMYFISDSCETRFVLSPQDFVVAMMGFIRGMAVNQKLLGSAGFPDAHCREIIFAVFDRCLLPPGASIAPSDKSLSNP
jgi:AcrR family transcriptional regulator